MSFFKGPTEFYADDGALYSQHNPIYGMENAHASQQHPQNQQTAGKGLNGLLPEPSAVGLLDNLHQSLGSLQASIEALETTLNSVLAGASPDAPLTQKTTVNPEPFLIDSLRRAIDLSDVLRDRVRSIMNRNRL